jgi:hypothetical protein
MNGYHWLWPAVLGPEFGKSMGGMYGLDHVLARVSEPGRSGPGNGPETDPR